MQAPREYDSVRYCNNSDPWLVQLDNGLRFSYDEPSLELIQVTSEQIEAALGEDYFA